jgi:hypothetical protein
MVKKAERVFMIIRSEAPQILRVITFTFLIFSCSPDLVDDPIPFESFPDIIITTSNHAPLNIDGGYIAITGGVRGIILYRKNSTTYLAFERNCSFQPNDACATVDVHVSTLFMQDACCTSSFNFEGMPTGGPAWRPLQQYHVSLAGNTLTITDEIVE